VETLTAVNVQEIKALSLDPFGTSKVGWKLSHPVFLTTLTTRTKMVVKAEMSNGHETADVQSSFRFGSKMMRQISREVHGNPLSHTEVMELSRVPLSKFCNHKPDPTKAREYLQDLIGAKKLYVWFKMDFVEQLEDLQTMVEKNGTGPLALVALKTEAVLKGLGKIVAVDIFLGNYDRFRSDGSLGGANNIFLQQVNQGNFNVVGLDFYMGAVGAKDINLCKESAAKWGGLVLNDSFALINFSKTAIASLNKYFTTEFQKTATPFQPNDLLGDKAWQHFRLGLADGQVTLKNYLQAYVKIKPDKVPAGVLERLKKLKWVA
jgi:hypothetical protein